MTLPERVDGFARLGKVLRELPDAEIIRLTEQAQRENGWFTKDSVKLAMHGIREMLDAPSLQAWASNYPAVHEPKSVGVAMAGNIPLVGFHDMLCVLLSGHRLLYKPSSKDKVLPGALRDLLCKLEPRFTDMIEETDRLKSVEALIATGSDNTSRYFDFYFRNVPHIIRRNRVSCAVLQGDEPDEEIQALGNDIFSYYGLGCRNVAFLWVPNAYSLKGFMERLEPFERAAEHHKYKNNYTYQKSLLLLNREDFLDNGFLLLRESESMVSPVAVLHYRFYKDLSELRKRIREQAGRLQVIVSAKGWYEGSIPFGTAQSPAATDYADGVDTMRFLSELGAGR